LRPFSFIQSKSFQNYSKGLNQQYSPPSEEKIKLFANQIKEEVFQIIKKNLKDMKFYSMTIDGWTSHQSQHYLNFSFIISMEKKL
jgi:hypothetical protein